MSKLTDKLKSDLVRLAASMAKGRHIKQLQYICEDQNSVSTRKLSIIVSSIEDRQKLDAVFLKKVFDLLVKLDNKT